MNKRSNERKELEENNKSKQGRRWGCIGLFVVLALVIIGGIGAKVAFDVDDFFDAIRPDNQVLQLDQTALTQKLENEEPFSVLILGTDYREQKGEVSRADTIMVATVNPQSEDVHITSIPRDLLVELPGTEDTIYDKINSTFAYGHVPYLKETVEDVLQIPIDAYAIMNFEGLVQLVDSVGGITVNSDMAFELKDEDTGKVQHIEKGRQQLDGRQALAYARMRKADPLGDYGRQQRQQEIIQALVKKLLRLETFSSYTEILDQLGDNIETSITIDQALLVFNNYRQAAQSIDTASIEGTDDSRYFPHYGLEVYVFDPDRNALRQTRTKLQQHLNVLGYKNELDENFDHFIDGFPLYGEDAVEELGLEEITQLDEEKDNQGWFFGNQGDQDDSQSDSSDRPEERQKSLYDAGPSQQESLAPESPSYSSESSNSEAEFESEPM